MPTLFTRVSEFFMQGIADALSVGSSIRVPHIGECEITGHLGPDLGPSGWSMQIDFAFPHSHSQMTVCLFTFGSCLLDDVKQYALPEPTYKDVTDEEFPPAHQAAWHELREEVHRELNAMGLTYGFEDEKEPDYYLIDDYLPSSGISGNLNKPGLLTPTLAKLCQSLLKKHSGWNFWIRFDLVFKDPRYRGRSEGLLIREDRIVLDMNLQRLHEEFGSAIGWPLDPANRNNVQQTNFSGSE